MEPGIFYVNLSDAIDLENKIDELAEAKAVIYDKRDGGRVNLFSIIPHLTTKPLYATIGKTPQIIYPNRKEWTYKPSDGYFIAPKAPVFKSKSIVITASSTISSGEAEMSFINYYHLAVTVGDTTAGCNGAYNEFSLPCGYEVRFTGTEILKHDGTQHYLNGYAPDYPVSKTIEAFKSGRDLCLEKALEIARNMGYE